MKLTNEQLKARKYANPLYTMYLGMKKRCYTPSTSGYDNYGGKGIKVCEEWKHCEGFINFYNWAINNGYSDELTLDDSIEKFENGMKISKECKEMLDNVEKRITILIDGEEKDFKPEEE